MTTKFTPGPWDIEYDNSDNFSGGCWYIAGPANIHFGYHASKEDEERALANAHLIAAAPELYEALEAAIELLASAEIQSSVRVKGMTKVIRYGDKALKKSRGES